MKLITNKGRIKRKIDIERTISKDNDVIKIMGKFEIESMPIARPDNSLICAHTTCKGLYVNGVNGNQVNGSANGNNVINGTIKDVPFSNGISKQLSNGNIFNLNGLKNGLKAVSEKDETMNGFETSLPPGLEILGSQVAGHCSGDPTGMGMLKQNGLVLKPLLKKDCADREINVYKQLETTADRSLIEMRSLVPKFHGVKTLKIQGREIDYLALEDLTKDFKEPCVMDIKIGKRTWGPNASYQKIMAEEKKYHDCKRDLGFCIPGFQVYKIHDGQLVKFDKDFGKTLDKDGAEDAIKTFLNAERSGFCRELLVQFLASLWRIQHFARSQRRLRLYASSVLLVYDARRLKEYLHLEDKKYQNSAPKLLRNRSLYRPLSLAVLNKDCCERLPTGFSGQLTKEGPILRPQSTKMFNLEVPSLVNNNNTWQKSIHTLKRTHSFQNDYDKDVQNKKQTYTYMLDDLCCENKSIVWASAKMIDFAHVHPAENCDVDKNYLEGIDNLVRLFEEFLADSEY